MCRIFSNSSNAINSDLESKSCTSLTILDIWEYLTVMIERINSKCNSKTICSSGYKTHTSILKQLEPLKTCYWFQKLEHQFFLKARVRKSNVRLGSIAHIFFVVSTIWFDCRTQSNSIHGLGSIVCDWDWLKFSSIGFDLLHRENKLFRWHVGSSQEHSTSGLLKRYHARKHDNQFRSNKPALLLDHVAYNLLWWRLLSPTFPFLLGRW